MSVNKKDCKYFKDPPAFICKRCVYGVESPDGYLCTAVVKPKNK